MTDTTSGREVEDDVGDVMCDAETEGGFARESLEIVVVRFKYGEAQCR